MIKNKYILGGGIAGLIAKHYNPEYLLISPDVGGQLVSNKKLLMTFFIHDTSENRELLDELKIKYKNKRIKIFYYCNKKVSGDVAKEDVGKFINNKMQEYDMDDNYDDSFNKILSMGENYMDILDTDINLLIKKLTPPAAEIINGKVKLINNSKKFIVILDKEGKLKKIEYDKLISTLPANDFFYMLYNYNKSYKFKYLPSTYVLSSNRPDFMKEDGLYYVNDSNKIYHRVQPFSNYYVYEITGFPSEEEIDKAIGGVIEIERRYVGLLFNEKIDDFKNIKFLGRMGQWNSSIHMEEVITKSKEIKANE